MVSNMLQLEKANSSIVSRHEGITISSSVKFKKKALTSILIVPSEI